MNIKVLLCVFGLIALSSAIPNRYKSAPQRTYAKAPAEEVEYEEVKVAPVSYTKAPVEEYSSNSRKHVSAASRAESERVSEEMASSAKYSFASAVDDSIMDQSQVRQETRDGLKVVGSYSYTDGFFKRTVRYEADENGYRVVGEETEPIGDGPVVDLVNGKADVHTQVEGVDTQYSISTHDIGKMTMEKSTKSRN